ncbi:MAG: hypothetical protein ACMXYG_05335 [Candidatus Woesearchaeota archaeon]
MEYLVEELRRDRSNGSNFKIHFEEGITLECAVDKLVSLLSSFSNKPQGHSIREQKKYGHIDLQWGELTIEDERVASHWLRVDGPVYDVYRVTENNMDFEEFENLYRFLGKQ